MQNAHARAIKKTQSPLSTLGWGLAAGLALLLTPSLGKADTTISHGYSNFGELRYGADMTHLDYVNPNAPKGGAISMWTQSNFDTFNRSTRKGTPAPEATLPYERLMVATADDPYAMYCLLCETIEYPESLDWVVFNLRDDVRFQDGTPMTAEDIAYTFNLYQTQGIAEYRNIVDGFIESVEVLDPHTIKFTFTEKAPKRERMGIVGSSYAYSKAWFEETGTKLDERSDRPFMATGPYVLGEFEFGREVNYVRAENYWGEDHPLNIGQNNLDKITFTYYADSTAAMEGFSAGAYTFRRENSSQAWAESYGFPNLVNGHVQKVSLPSGEVGAAQNFIFNLDTARWQDPLVRDAIKQMFNFEWSNEKLFHGLYARVDSFWPGTDLTATGTPSEGEIAILTPLVEQGLLPASILTDEAVLPPVHDASDNKPSRKIYRAAGKLLDEAGWIAGSDGIRAKDGAPLTLTIVTYSPLFDRIVNPFIENLKVLGVAAKLERVDIPQFIERTRSGDFDMITHTFDMPFEPGIGLEQWYHSKTADDSSRNLMRLRHAGVDALLPSVVKAKSLDELKTATMAIDRVLRSIGFAVPQWYKNVHTLAYYDMYEHPDPLPPLASGELSFWWVNKDKEAALKAAGVLQ